MLSRHMNKKTYRIVENYRTFDKNDGYETDELCDYCAKPAEQYIVLEGYIYICKSLILQ